MEFSLAINGIARVINSIYSNNLRSAYFSDSTNLAAKFQRF